jgi:hypothetical protein
MLLKNQMLAPPGGWKYYQDETGYWINAITEETLVRRVAAHRHNNQLAPVKAPHETLAAEIEDWICQRMTPRNQSRHCDMGVRHVSGVVWSAVVDFLKSNLAYFASGQEQVTQDEAERRASICATCPLNVPVVGCGACAAAIKEYRTKIAGVQGTKVDGQLRACGICKCDLKTIVHFPLATLRAKGDNNFPDWCWQKRGGVSELPSAPLQERTTLP